MFGALVSNRSISDIYYNINGHSTGFWLTNVYSTPVTSSHSPCMVGIFGTEDEETGAQKKKKKLAQSRSLYAVGSGSKAEVICSSSPPVSPR